MADLDRPLKLPDLWQQAALRHLAEGCDLVVDAPTGAGKTYIFELLLENGFAGHAVYTVPTRALANDKLLEWKALGWKVGLVTGDRSWNADAPVVVATLETQKSRLLRGEGPDLLVIDEYQMLGDHQRGLNYEIAIAAAPSHTRLLLLSGSVGNPAALRQWLRRLGRPAELVSHRERPVPLEEVAVEALPDRIPESVRGYWPRAAARILKAGMAPLLLFAPRRRAAEDIALEIARYLPEEDPIVLTPEQEKLAGHPLRSLLRARVAFHHSGLHYGQRAALVEPLAKAGQLRVVVATMGLAAGINFSMRSVLVTDRTYRSGEQTREVRPDELLQMFGRAGRRGLDRIGYVLTLPGKPRLREARHLRLRRNNQTDWPGFLGVMRMAEEANQAPAEAARHLAGRLFSEMPVRLGLAGFSTRAAPAPQTTPRLRRQAVTEFCDPDGTWHRLRPPRLAPLDQCLLLHRNQWLPALARPETLADLPFGQPCKLPGPADPAHPHYGRRLPVARFGRDEREGELVLNRWVLRQLRQLTRREPSSSPRAPGRLRWTLDRIEQWILPQLPAFCHGGRFHAWEEKNGTLSALLHFQQARARAYFDAHNRPLINPPTRQRHHEVDLALPHERQQRNHHATPAEWWFTLGLIDESGRPTRRGRLFSFFNYGEGLAVAAALEDDRYDLVDLLPDLANIRAGHRFSELNEGSGRLAAACRIAYGMLSLPGYLHRGLPETYGEGAAEVLFGSSSHRQAVLQSNHELRLGDIQRAQLEWRSLLRHIAAAPGLDWPRWLDLRQLARKEARRLPRSASGMTDLPPLTPRQQQRHKSFLQLAPE